MQEILQVPVSISNVPISCPAAPLSAGAAHGGLLLMQMNRWWEFSKLPENVWAILSYFVSVASVSGYTLKSQKNHPDFAVSSDLKVLWVDSGAGTEGGGWRVTCWITALPPPVDSAMLSVQCKPKEPHLGVVVGYAELAVSGGQAMLAPPVETQCFL